MLENCVNVKSLEFQDLLEQSKLDAITLANKISRWQDTNGVDNYPTLEDIYNYDIVKDLTFDEIERVSNLIINKLTIKDRPFFKRDRSKIKDDIWYKSPEYLAREVAISNLENITGNKFSNKFSDKLAPYGLTIDELKTAVRNIENEDLISIWTDQLQGIENWQLNTNLSNLISRKNVIIEFSRRGINSLSSFSEEQQSVIKDYYKSLFKDNKYKTDKQAIYLSYKTAIERINNEIEKAEHFKSLFSLKKQALIKKYNNLLNLAAIDKDYKSRIANKIISEINRVTKFQQSEYAKNPNISNVLKFRKLYNEADQITSEARAIDKVEKEGMSPKVSNLFTDINYEAERGEVLSETTTVDVLTKIKDGNSNYKELATTLLEYAKKNNISISLYHTIPGEDGYIGASGKTYFTFGHGINKEGRPYSFLKDLYININYNSSYFKSNPERLLLHEIVHTLTTIAIEDAKYKNKDSINPLTKFMKYVTSMSTELRDIKRKGMFFADFSQPYGFTNESEFISEVLTNTEFQELLKAIPPMEDKEFNNLFEEILAWITKLFGIKTYSNAFEQAYDIAISIADIQSEFELYENIKEDSIAANFPNTVQNIPSNINDSTDEKNHIKIKYNARTQLGRDLSNLSPSKFIYQEMEFASVEAWWHWYKLSNAKMSGLFQDLAMVDEDELDNLRGLSGYKALEEGRRLAKKYEYLSMAYPNKAILKEIYMLKLANSPQLKTALLNSTLPFYHYKDRLGDGMNTKFQWTADLWDEIRSELKGEKKNDIIISSEDYTKNTPSDKSKGYFFTENLQAYLALRNRLGEQANQFPNVNPKLNVTASNNQAGIRTDVSGNRNLNSFAIISKKYQQDASGQFVKEEGQFKDTNEDFELFKKYNTEAIQEALNYNKPLVISGKGIATGKSALPLRFAEWLNNELFTKLGIQGEIKENNTSGYSGYGIYNLKVSNKISTPIVTNNPQYPNKPNFNKLPAVSSTPTMFYTGVGSRETPKEILDQMAEVAKQLEQLGYTVRTGDADGADKAFRNSVTKKEMYVAAMANAETMKIAQEIHPAWGALSDYAKKLQARNTFQVFGDKLDIPSDFVLAWTPDGLTDYKNRVRESGGTGQAIDMASRKNIPVINMANPNWKEELERIVMNANIPIISEQEEIPNKPIPTLTRRDYDVEELKKAFPEYLLEGFDTGEQVDEIVDTITYMINVEFINNGQVLKVKEAHDKIRKAFEDKIANLNVALDYAKENGFTFDEKVTNYFSTVLINNTEDLQKRIDNLNVVLSQFDTLYRRSLLHVKYLGLQIKGDIAIQSEEGILIDNEDLETVGEAHRFEKVKYNDKARFEVNPKSTSSFRFSVWLATQKKYEIVDGEIRAKRNYIGEYSRINYDTLYDSLLTDLADTEVVLGEKGANGIYTGLLGVLQKIGEVKPEYNIILQDLIKPENYDLATEFVNAMANHYHPKFSNWNTNEYSNNEKIGRHTRFLASDTFIGYQQIKDEWLEIQKSLPITKEDNGSLVIDLDEVHRIRDEWNDFVRAFYKYWEDTASDPSNRVYKSFEDFFRSEGTKKMFRNMLADLGIRVSFPTIDQAFNDPNYVFNSSVNDALRLENSKGNPITNNFLYYIFNAFEPKEKEEDNLQDDGRVSRLELNNPINGPKSERLLTRLASIEFNNRFAASISSINGHNDLEYNISQYTFISNVVRKLAKKDSTYLAMVDKTAIAMGSELSPGSLLVSDLKNNDEFRRQFRVIYFDSSRERNRNREFKMRDEMDASDQTVDAISAYYNNNGKLAWYYMLTHYNNTLAPMIPMVKREFDLQFGKDNEFNIADGHVDLVMREVFSEIHRIEHMQNSIKETGIFPDYDIAANYFLMFPYLNPDSLAKLVEAGKIDQTEMDSIWDPKSKEDDFMKLNVSKSGLDTIRKIVNNVLVKEINDTIKDWTNLGIITNNNGVLNSRVIDIDYLNKEKNRQHSLRNIAANFYINSLVAYTEMYRVIYGDPAIYAKIAYDKDGRGIIDYKTTLEFIQKRLKGAISPHMIGRWDKQFYNRITINNRVIDLKLDEYIAKFGETTYNKIDTTDGLEWTSMREAIEAKKAYHKIDKVEADRLIAKIDAAYALPKDDPDYGYYEFTPEELTVILGQNKFASFTPKFYEQFKMMMIDMTKSSDINLYPPYTRGMELDKLRIFMEENNIDRAAHKSADKMGTSKIVSVWNTEGNISTDLDKIAEDFNTKRDMFVRTLSREDMGMQQELPQGKSEIQVSTQADKHLFLYARNLNGFKYKGSEWTGKKLEEEKHRVRIALMKLGKSRVEEKFGITYDVMGRLQIKDLSKLKAILEEEADARKWQTQDIKGLQVVNGELMIPMFFNNSVKKIESIILSILTKEIIRHKQHGTGFTQSSQAGLRPAKVYEQDEVKLEDFGIVFTKNYNIKEGLQPLRSTGSYNKPAQVFITWNFKDLNGNLLKMEDFMTNGLIDFDKLLKEVLQMISFRIPGQGHNSMLPVEVVGFIPASYGDVVIVPDSITKQMGSDFDIDKLYSYMTAYYYNKLDGTINKISEKDIIYKDNTIESLTNTITDTSDKLDKISRVKKNINQTLTAVKNEKIDQEFIVDSLFDSIRKGEPIEDKELDEAMESVRNMIEDEKDLKDTLKNLNQTVEQLQQMKFEAESKLEILKVYTEESLLKQDYKDIFWSVLSHKGMFDHIMNPLENGDLANEQDLLVRTRTQYINTWGYQRDSFINQIQSANQIAPFALSLALHSMIENIPTRYHIKTEKGHVESKIKFFRLDGSTKPLSLVKFNGEGKSKYKNKKGETFERTVHDNINIQLSASVDSKNLASVGINKYTTNVSTIISIFQTDKDQGLHFGYNTRFLSQEAVQVYCKYLDINLRNTSDDFFSNMKALKFNAYLRTMKYIESKIGEPFYEKEDSYKNMSFSAKELLDLALIHIDGKEKNKEYYIKQAKVLEMYRTLDYIADKYVTNRGAILTPVTNGPGISFSNAIALQEKVSKVADNYTLFGMDKVFKDTDAGYAANEILNFTVQLGKLLNPQYVILNRIESKFKKRIGEDELSEKLRDTLITEFKKAVFAGFPLLYGVNDVNEIRRQLVFTTANNVSHARMMEAYNDQTNNSNIYTSRFGIEKATDFTKPDIIKYNKLRNSNILDEAVVKFIDMLTSPDPKIRALAQDHALYAYITGNISGKDSFSQTVPIEYQELTGFNKALRELTNFIKNEDTSILEDIFIDQFIQHQPWRIKTINPDAIKQTFGPKVGNLPFAFTVFNLEERPELVSSLLVNDELPEEFNYYDNKNYRWGYYKKAGSIANHPVYVMHPTKGKANAKDYNISEYDFSGWDGSIFVENQIPKVNVNIPFTNIRKVINKSFDIDHTHDNDIVVTPNIVTYSLAEKIEDEINKLSDNGKLSYQSLIGRIAETPYYSLISKLIRTKLIDQNAKIDVEIDYTMAASAETINKGTKVLKIKLNPALILKEFSRYQFATDEEYLEACLNHVLVHEGIHAMLIPITRNKSTNSTKVNAILSSLDRMRETVISELEKKYPGITQDVLKFQEAIQKAKEGTLKASDLDSIRNNMAYALASTDEFIVGVLINKQLQQELNEIKTNEQSILDKIIDFISTLFKYLAEELGITINDDSVLKVAIEDIMALSELPMIDPDIREDGILESLFALPEQDNIEDYDLYDEYGEIETKISKENQKLIESINTQIKILSDKKTGNMSIDDRLDIDQKIERLEQSRNMIISNQNAESIKKAGNLQLDYAEYISLKDKPTVAELHDTLQITDLWKDENTKFFMEPDVYDDLTNAHRIVFNELNNRATQIGNRLSNRIYAHFANDILVQTFDNMTYSPEELQTMIDHPKYRYEVEDALALKLDELKPYINGKPEETYNSIRSKIENKEFKVNPDLLKKITPINYWQSMALDNSMSGNPISDIVVRALDGASKNFEDLMEKALADNEKQFDKLKDPRLASKIGKNFALFRQEDNTGFNGRLVNQYSSKYHMLKDELEDKINKAKYAYEHSKETSDLSSLKNAWTLYNSKINDISIPIDIRFFFRPDFRTTLPGYAFKSQAEYRDYLYKEFGKDLADELIQNAKNKYKEYIKARDYKVAALAEDDSISDKEANKNIWIQQNDPLLALDGIMGESVPNEVLVNNKSKFVIKVPRKYTKDGKDSGFYDPKYEIILADPDLREFYHYLINKLDERNQVYPEDVTKYRLQNLIPHVTKDIQEISREDGMMAALKYAGNKMFDVSSKHATLLRYVNNPNGYLTYPNGEPYQKLPIYFMENIPKGGTPFLDEERKRYIQEQSEDLRLIMSEHIKASYAYEYKNQVHDIVRLAKRMMKDSKEIVIDNEGRKVADRFKELLLLNTTNDNAYKTLEYYIDAMLYDKRKDRTKTSNIPVGVAGIGYKEVRPFASKQQIANRKRELELESLRDKLEEDLFTGKITGDVYEGKIEEYEKEYRLIARKNLVWGKMGDKLLTYTQLKGLGLNINSGLANLGFGLITNLMHAAGKVDFDNKSLMKAFTMMFQVMKWKSVEGKKISTLLHKYHILFDIDESRYGEDGQLMVKLWDKKIDPYVFQTKTEFYNQGLSFLAHMYHVKVKSKNGDIPLYEAYDNNGNWRTELFDDSINKEWSMSIDALTSNNFSKTRDRIIQFNKAIHGNYDPTSPVRAKKYLIGRMAFQFRSWIPEGVDSRFGAFRWDRRLGRFREGRYKTYAHLGLKGSLTTLGKMYGRKEEAFVINGKKMMPWEIENMRRNLAEINMFASMTIALVMMNQMLNYLDDDDDPNSELHEMAAIYTINVLQRVQADISFYLNPNTFTNIVNNPVAVMKTYSDFRNAVVGSWKHMTDDEYQGEPSWIKWSKAFPYTNQVPKFMYMTERRMSY